VGELVVRGDHVMQGYWRDPEQTAQKLSPGRFPGDRVLRTGDLFRRDEDGYLYFVSRSDDVILTRGEKVAPHEVESVLLTAPGVREAAVVGRPDERLGQAVVAHVSAMPGFDLVPAQLRGWCAQHLEEVRVPRYVVLHGELPKLSSGKVDRMALLGGTAQD
jgi:acyl-CoA synthetase (AMP-forming)/AMP-acid ligase II